MDPDLIYFTGRVLRCANYYVQQLFGQNSGDAYLTTSITATGKPPKLTASAVRDSQSGDVILKIVNGADAPAPLAVALAGLGPEELRAKQTLLTGGSADAFNEDGKEPAVRPISEELKLKANFDYEAPPHSLSGCLEGRAEVCLPPRSCL